MIKEKITSKKGFFVGDVCYALSKENYKILLAKSYDYTCHIYKNGKFEIEKDKFIVWASTAYGDGDFEDNSDRLFSVDSGTLGIVPFELVDNTQLNENAYGCFYICEVAGTAEFSETDGFFTIILPNGEKIEIDTKS